MAPRHLQASGTTASRWRRAAPALVLGGCLVPCGGAGAQVVAVPVDTVSLPLDTSDVLSRARAEQARFERRRVRLLPSSWGGGSGPCEERIGRFCFWFDDDGSDPPPEPAEVGEARDLLLAHLDSVQALLPDEGWIAGQRVWYRAEAGRWEEAVAAAGSCGAEGWWCAALRGLALHGAGRIPESERAFEEALAGMDPERAERWRDTRFLLDGDAREAQEARASRGEGPASLVWVLADPLLLAPGNDRLTEHYARWTAAAIKEEARNPFGLRWGRDMEELTVRMGWEVGWERVAGTGLETQVVGRHAPEARDFFPDGDGLRTVEEADPSRLQPDDERPRSLYASRLAPSVADMDGQVAVFPRGSGMVVVATHFLPPDTVGGERRARRDSLRAALAAPGLDTLPRVAGLFLLPEDGGAPRVARVRGEEEGALLLRAPAGRYVAAVESWDPPARRAGRHRRGISRDTVPPDVAVLSDLLLVRDTTGQGGALDDVAAGALVRAAVEVGRPVAVAWEVTGLGWAPEEIRYELSVRRAGVGLLRRLGELVGVVDRERPLSLTWEEPGPLRPGPVLRVVGLGLAGADPGTYEVLLRAHLAGRGVLTSAASLTLLPPRS